MQNFCNSLPQVVELSLFLFFFQPEFKDPKFLLKGRDIILKAEETFPHSLSCVVSMWPNFDAAQSGGWVSRPCKKSSPKCLLIPKATRFFAQISFFSKKLSICKGTPSNLQVYVDTVVDCKRALERGISFSWGELRRFELQREVEIVIN